MKEIYSSLYYQSEFKPRVFFLSEYENIGLDIKMVLSRNFSVLFGSPRHLECEHYPANGETYQPEEEGAEDLLDVEGLDAGLLPGGVVQVLGRDVVVDVLGDDPGLVQSTDDWISEKMKSGSLKGFVILMGVHLLVTLQERGPLILWTLLHQSTQFSFA